MLEVAVAIASEVEELSVETALLEAEDISIELLLMLLVAEAKLIELEDISIVTESLDVATGAEVEESLMTYIDTTKIVKIFPSPRMYCT